MLASFSKPSNPIFGKVMKRPYIDDPQPGDENDPEYLDEIFRTFQHMGWKPEDLQDKKDQDEYRKWLETHGKN